MTAKIRQLQGEIDQLVTLVNSAQSTSNFFVTPSKLDACGAAYNAPDILPIPCQHCGKLLEPHGFYVEFLNRHSWVGHERCYCNQSMDANKAMLAQKKEEMEALICGEEQEQIEKLLKASGLGKRFMGRTFDSFVVDAQNKHIFETANKYCDTFEKHRETGKGLFLFGQCGTGKTHIAAAIAHRLMSERRVSVLFTTGIELLNYIKATFKDDSQSTESKVVELYKKCGLLIIDDIGKERISEWALSIYSNIINSRYEAQLPVIITTNYDDEELILRMAGKDGDTITAESIVSRLHEITYGVKFRGDDRRRVGERGTLSYMQTIVDASIFH